MAPILITILLKLITTQFFGRKNLTHLDEFLVTERESFLQKRTHFGMSIQPDVCVYIYMYN